MRCATAAVAVALLIGVAASSGYPVTEQDGTCSRRSSPPFLDAIGSRCPFVQIEPSPPLEVGALLLLVAALSDDLFLSIVSSHGISSSGQTFPCQWRQIVVKSTI